MKWRSLRAAVFGGVGVGLAGLCAAPGAGAQATPPDAGGEDSEITQVSEEALVNLDTPLLPALRRGFYSMDVRAPGAVENQTYLNFSALFGLRRDLAVVLRATGSPKKTYTQSLVPFVKGGREIELALKLGLPSRGAYRMAAQAGVLFPDTGSRRTPYLGGELLVSRQFGSRATLYFVPRFLFPNRTLVTLGGGASLNLNDNFTFFADIQGPITGSNTFSTFTGSPMKREIWGFGFRYTPSAYGGRASLDLGVTNGLGRTTGFSTTPALSGSAAFYVNLTYRN